MSRADFGDFAGATQDAEIAGKLFASQGNARGEALSKELVETIVTRQKPTEPNTGGGGWMNAIGALGSILLKLL
jgi:hypothetical protein